MLAVQGMAPAAARPVCLDASEADLCVDVTLVDDLCPSGDSSCLQSPPTICTDPRVAEVCVDAPTLDPLCSAFCIGLPACAGSEECLLRDAWDTAAELLPCLEPAALKSPVPLGPAGCPPTGYQPNPGTETCVWGVSLWCFQPDDVGQVPSPGGVQNWCFPGQEAVRAGGSTFTSRMYNAWVSDQLGDAFVSTWELRSAVNGLLLGTGAVTFHHVAGTSNPKVFQTLAPIALGPGTPGDCDDLFIIAPAPCTFHCGAKFLRYL